MGGIHLVSTASRAGKARSEDLLAGAAERFLLRGLRIGISTVSIVELLRSNWTDGICVGVALLVFLQADRRLPPLSPETEA